LKPWKNSLAKIHLEIVIAPVVDHIPHQNSSIETMEKLLLKFPLCRQSLDTTIAVHKTPGVIYFASSRFSFTLFSGSLYKNPQHARFSAHRNPGHKVGSP
jgi:hypothetical protein